MIGVIAEQQGPKMRPRSFRIGQAQDDKFLAGKRFGFPPHAAVPRRITRADRLGDHALEAELAGVLQEEFTIARPNKPSKRPFCACACVTPPFERRTFVTTMSLIGAMGKVP